MKVMLIAPPIMDAIDGRLRVVGVDALRECPPLGIYGLAAVLEAQGHEVVVCGPDSSCHPFAESVEKDVDTSDLVGVGATSMAWPAAADVIRQVRQRRPDVPIVCGGIHPTLFDRYILSVFPIQFVVRGEGETAIGRLCTALAGGMDLSGVPNLSWTDSAGRLVRNPIDPKLHNSELASVPLPDKQIQDATGKHVQELKIQLAAKGGNVTSVQIIDRELTENELDQVSGGHKKEGYTPNRNDEPEISRFGERLTANCSCMASRASRRCSVATASDMPAGADARRP